MSEMERRPQVLVGVDGSPASERALAFAVQEARLRGAVLVAVMAVDIPDYAWIDPYGTRIHPEEATLALAREKLSRLVAAAGTDGLVVDEVVTAVPAAQALVDRSEDCELLVVGSRGRGGFRGLVMGSVSMQCMLHAHCPVTVIRPEPEPDAAPTRTIDDVRRETTAPSY